MFFGPIRVYGWPVETKASAINRALGTLIRGRLREHHLSVAKAAELSGISATVLTRIVSKDPRDINVTQLTEIARVLDTTPATLMAEAHARTQQVSDGSATNVTPIRRPDSVEELEQYAGPKAAHGRDPESDTDE